MAKSAREKGRELGVDYLLEGTIRRERDRLRITAQLVQVSDQPHVWAEISAIRS
jgi:adenylate cyclase